jgi:hypothetical protein
MADITIEKKSESSQSWEFEVTVVVDWEKTAHRVTLDRTYLEGLVGVIHVLARARAAARDIATVQRARHYTLLF